MLLFLTLTSAIVAFILAYWISKIILIQCDLDKTNVFILWLKKTSYCFKHTRRLIPQCPVIKFEKANHGVDLDQKVLQEWK